MKISLIYNASAGRRMSLEALRELIEREGHELLRVVEHSDDCSALAAPPAELVVAAGGDGTVADAVRASTGHEVPLAILPVGTANNLAFTFGLTGPLEHIVRSWHDAPARPFDVGILTTTAATHIFVEGVGAGLVETCMRSFRHRPLRKGELPALQLQQALLRYQETLARQRPRQWTLRVDGRRVTDEFLLVEILNARAVGPNLELSRDASPSDGRLTLVAVRESERSALASYLDERLAGRTSVLTLPTERAQRVDLHGPDALHIDDELTDVAPGEGVSIRVSAGAARVLVPPVPPA
jgi:diacylglycerol kinase family enzyme